MENVEETSGEKPNLKDVLTEQIKRLEEKKSSMYFFVIFSTNVFI